ncbi:biotin/lipoate A/B protein ligase family protein [Salarchaeum sp. JOR-1]|uniref:lipoate--protein ligase family protein n=1 Tax=Salarchaeum sp. JOR-1 TaxID=2599399 RepID=UPI001198C188|nr:biotin/lipoate A/B protein ligase family protein [Salarchaeum sp. JOR-1]QDX39865.1 lipoate--protein ligase family protein [Salarchaeum sp. JOR-1]
MDLANREWRLITEETWRGPTNMALDEVAARTAAVDGLRTARVYRWGPSTLSLGYNQAPESVNWEFCEDDGITVTRRPTGGGGIYHDYTGDISYTVVAPADELPGDLMDAYHALCRPILDALSRMGIDADYVAESMPEIHRPACYLRELHPAHDIVADGKKISGNAQYRQRDAVIQHGSLSYSLATDRHLGAFSDPPAPETFENRVTSIRELAGITRDEAVSAVEDALADWADADPGAWTDTELVDARDLAAEKYATDAWTRGKTT